MPELTANSDATPTTQTMTIGGRSITSDYTHTAQVTRVSTYEPQSGNWVHSEFGKPVEMFHIANSNLAPTSDASTLRQSPSGSAAVPTPSNVEPGATLPPTAPTATSSPGTSAARKRVTSNYFGYGTWGTDSPNRQWPNKDRVYLRAPQVPSCQAGFGLRVDEATGEKLPVAYVSRNVGYDEDGFPRTMEETLESVCTDLGTRGAIKYAVVPSDSGKYERWFAGARQKRADEGVMYWEDEWEGPMVVSNYLKSGTAKKMFDSFTAQSSTAQ